MGNPSKDYLDFKKYSKPKTFWDGFVNGFIQGTIVVLILIFLYGAYKLIPN